MSQRLEANRNRTRWPGLVNCVETKYHQSDDTLKRTTMQLDSILSTKLFIMLLFRLLVSVLAACPSLASAYSKLRVPQW